MKVNKEHEFIDNIDLSDLPVSELECPRCGVWLLVYIENYDRGIDNEITWLVCPSCHYAEKE